MKRYARVEVNPESLIIECIKFGGMRAAIQAKRIHKAPHR